MHMKLTEEKYLGLYCLHLTFNWMLQTVEVVAAVAAKVGPDPSPEDLDMVVKVVASQQNGLAESGMSLKESKRMSKLLSDLVRNF